MKLVVLAFFLCFFSRDEVHGLHRVCWYDCPLGQVAVTIDWHGFCPRTVEE